MVWTLRDISERARLDKVKSDFVATASHELRSPLTSIKGFVELLGRSQALGDREREFVDVILQSTDRLVDLVNDLLDASRLEAGKMEIHPRLFDVTEMVREVAALMGPRVTEKDQRLDLDLPPSLPRALADPVRVRQILTNLVSNAHLYTGEGGRITITLDRVEDGLSIVRVGHRPRHEPGRDRPGVRPLRAPRGRRGRHRARPVDREVAGGSPGRVDRREQPRRRGDHVHGAAPRGARDRERARLRAWPFAASGCWWWTTSGRSPS